MRIKTLSKGAKHLATFGVILVLLLMGTKLFQDKAWFLSIFFFISASLIFYTYSISKKTPAKYLLPGVLLLTLFHIYPAFYSGAVAFTNDSNGHQLSKEQAIAAIVQDSKVPIDSYGQIKYQTLIQEGSKAVHILFTLEESRFWLASEGEVKSVQIPQRNISSDGSVLKLDGFAILTPRQVSDYIS